MQISTTDRCEGNYMKIDNERIIESILESLDQMEYIQSSKIPNIDLYMDQVLTFMNGHLANAKRYEDDKVLTKTMINNYAKNHLLPAPDKKKYSKEHILILLFIYYFKNILSISDIQTILKPLTEGYFGRSYDLNIEKIYEEVFQLEDGRIEQLKQAITEDFSRASDTFSAEKFPDIDEDERKFFQTFSFICMLSYDIYIKKQIIENLVDACTKNAEETSKK